MNKSMKLVKAWTGPREGGWAGLAAGWQWAWTGRRVCTQGLVWPQGGRGPGLAAGLPHRHPIM